ncbi:hypothetical protein COB57_02415 [Candidatus Peregrinibacteria bacterium]|nr:MAG: hypothetical protein COB57_02415 [Candidatus Peregrinibacteria bacterium]
MKHFFLFLLGLFLLNTNVSALSLHELQDANINADLGGTHIPIDSVIIAPANMPHLPKINNVVNDFNKKIFNEEAVKDNTQRTIEIFVYKIIDFILYVSGIIAVILIIVSGFMITTGQTDSGKTMLQNTIFGLLLIFLSYAIVENIIDNIYQVPDSGNYEKLDNLDQTNIYQ